MSNSILTSNITSANTTKELLHMFMAAIEIQEVFMYDKETNNYKHEYREILDILKDANPEISNTLEAKIFRFSERWSNDLLDLCEELVQEELGDYNADNERIYIEKHVKKYIDQYFEVSISRGEGL